MGTLAQRTIQPEPSRQVAPEHPQLARIEATLLRLEKMLDEFCGVFLNTRFSGKGNDRWSRR
jgi:hypothetical protein